MIKLILTLTLALYTAIAFATEIEVTVVFENLTKKEMISGEFTIIDLNVKTEIKSDESFKITLPEKGKYHFSFASVDFIAYTFYPVRINKSNNIITIRLTEKPNFKNRETYAFPIYLETNLTDEQFEKRIVAENLNFIMNGINASIPEEYVCFKNKYGIGLIIENCVIDPLAFKKATKNNQLIFEYLNSKYGTEWQKALKSKPIGIK
ncbi:hypothetical protein [Formosa haliotis]|uniref:FEKKY domain-containing protein n=1 Tax=Formosa haliotis TaxID=1555194 RepID=UPI0008255A9C|nr:hypothetical protein [Formosa haliotis]